MCAAGVRAFFENLKQNFNLLKFQKIQNSKNECVSFDFLTRILFQISNSLYYISDFVRISTRRVSIFCTACLNFLDDLYSCCLSTKN